MSNLIQIKRSLNTANATGLANGELAYTANGDVLFIGSNGTIQAIGGVRNPGVLTANQALVANATSGIDKVIVANAVVTKIYANGSHGSGQSLLANSTGGIYWGSVAGSVSLDDLTDAAVSGASAGQVLIANSTGYFRNVSLSGDVTVDADGVVTISADSTVLGTDTTGDYVASITAGDGISGTGSGEGSSPTIAVVANNGIVSNSSGVFAKAANGISVDSSGINVTAGADGGLVSNASGVFVKEGQGLITNSTGLHVGGGDGVFVNTTSVSVLANSGIVANSTGLFANVDGSTLELSGGSIRVKDDGIALGTKTTGNYVATITAGSGLSGNATTEGSTPTIAVVAGSGVASNSTGVHVVAGSGITSNSTGVFVTDGDGLSVNSTGVHVGAGDGLSVNSTAVAVVAGSGIASNSTGVHVVAGTGVVSNSTGVHIGQPVATTDNVTFNDVTINGNTILGSATSDVVSITGRVNTSIVPSANVTYDLGTSALRWKDLYLSGSTITLGNSTMSDAGGSLTLSNTTINDDLTVSGNTVLGSNTTDRVTVNGLVSSSFNPSANVTYNLGTNTSRWLEVHAQNVHSEFLYIDKDVTIGGNLTISGNLVSVNVSTLSVTDSMIQLASNNTLSDSLDIGFFGSYNPDSGDHEHAGLFRDATDDKFKLFKGLQVSPTTTVDTSNNTYQTATLQAYLDSGGLTTNSTSVALAANSTVAVTITANSLTLATALGGTSGGTGLASYTAEDILVANSSNGFRKLNKGSEGYVLQISSGVVAYGTLDGGTF